MDKLLAAIFSHTNSTQFENEKLRIIYKRKATRKLNLMRHEQRKKESTNRAAKAKKIAPLEMIPKSQCVAHAVGFANGGKSHSLEWQHTLWKIECNK